MKIKWNQKSGVFEVIWGNSSVEIGTGDPDPSKHSQILKIYSKGPLGPSRKKVPQKAPSKLPQDYARPMPVPPPGVMGYAVITRKGVVPRRITSQAEFERVVREEIVRSAQQRTSQRKIFSSAPRKASRFARIVDVGLTQEGVASELDEVMKSVLHSRSGVVGLRLYKK